MYGIMNIITYVTVYICTCASNLKQRDLGSFCYKMFCSVYIPHRLIDTFIIATYSFKANTEASCHVLNNYYIT